MNRDPLRVGSSIIGWIERTGCDNYWTIATLHRSDDFEAYKDAFEATLNEDDGDQARILATNDLELTVGDPPSPIRDFHITSESTVEFKEAPWV